MTVLSTNLMAFDRLRSRVVKDIEDDSMDWEIIPDFDINQHVHEIQVDSEKELHEYIESLLGKEMDKTQPLWNFHYIENKGKGKSATILNIHHGNSLISLFFLLIFFFFQITFLEISCVKIFILAFFQIHIFFYDSCGRWIVIDSNWIIYVYR